MRTFKILRWDEKPDITNEITLDCPYCGTESILPIDARSIPLASNGMGTVFDHPSWIGMIPQKIQCRKCHRVFENQSAIPPKSSKGKV